MGESDNASDMATGIAKLASVFEYAVYPVIDIDDGIRVAERSRRASQVDHLTGRLVLQPQPGRR